VLWRLPEIKLAPDLIYTIPGINFPITNTLLCTWISIIILIALFFIGTRNRNLIPNDTHSFMGWMQNFIEWIVDFLRGLAESVAGKTYGRKFFPLAATFFVFILVSNLLDVIPGVDTIGAINWAGINAVPNHGEPVLGFLLFGNISNQIVAWIRPATTDLNLTLSMALIAVVTAQVWGFATLGAGEHLNKYLNVRALRKGGFVIVRGFPCKVMNMSTSKTGKHGGAKIHMTAIDIFTGRKYEEIFSSTENIDVPLVSKAEYQLIDIDDEGFMSLMTDDGATKEDLKVPEGEVGDQIREAHGAGKELSISTIIAMGKEEAQSFKESKADE